MFLIDIDKYWSDLWASDFELNQDLHLPEENKYIGKAPEHAWNLPPLIYLRIFCGLETIFNFHLNINLVLQVKKYGRSVQLNFVY